ncbi:GH39 family glycosyl hydrolase [Pedobacter frigidisoli]|uniref:GH39 family glycosyl hydrolase n=1 Tax=Pedobacter frigidisoli TaxID=2530455 RepID=UPI00292D4156|nr:glycoside hydrolase [Pedobacter frigidisoli]
MIRRKFLKNTLFTSAGILLSPAISTANGFFDVDLSTDLSVNVDGTAAGKPFKHFWSKCVGAGRANEGLRASWLEQLALTKKDCGFQYCRFHGLLHDDMFVYKEIGGKPFYNWQYIDELFDRMLSIGVRPFVEFGFMPKDLASDLNATQFWWKGNVSPPNNYAKWAGLVGAFTQHCIDRYGLDEVKQWYFEVWNEPNLWGFWQGTKLQYFELYKVSVQAIKAVNKDLRVGGPATSNYVPDDRFAGEKEDKSKHKTFTVQDIDSLEWQGVWIKDFLIYCSEKNLPVDFVSTHPYPTDWALDPMTGKGGGKVRNVNATKTDLVWLKKTVASSPYPHAELHCTEWSSSPSSRDTTHDSLQAATYIVKANLDGIGLVDSLSYWTFSDIFEEKGGGDAAFHGGFGMINFQGVVKPTFHAYRMLNQLGNEILHQEEGIIITRNSADGKMSVLIYHYPNERKQVVDGDIEQVLKSGSSRKFDLRLTRLKSTVDFTEEILDADHGYALQDWKKMGSPVSPTREQTQMLKKRALATDKRQLKTDRSDGLIWRKTLSPWTVILLKQA